MTWDFSRRKYLAGIVTTGVTSCAGCAGLDTNTGDETVAVGINGTVAGGINVPMYGHNPARTGALPDRTGPTDTVSAQWQFDDNEGYVLHPPTVVNNRVYIGSTDNYLYALDAVDGTRQWSVEAGDAISGSPAVVDGIVYFGSSDRRLYAISADSGDSQWLIQLDQPVLSGPTVTDGTVYVTTGD